MKRMRRREYLLFNLAVLVFGGLCAYVAMGGTLDKDNPASVYYPGAAAAVLGLLSIVDIAMSVRRLHDIGTSGWWAVFLIVPVANLVLWLVLLVWPGTRGLNDYGRDPRRRADRVEVAGVGA